MTQTEIVLQELKEIFEDPESFLKVDYILRLKELLKTIRDNPEQIHNEISRLEQELLDDGYCPKCGERLRIRENSEDREYQGGIFPETINTQYCPNGDWIEDKD